MSNPLRFALSVLTGFLLATTAYSFAHDWNELHLYGRKRWKSSHHPPGLQVHWRFHDEFPGPEKRDRVKEAFGKWDAQGQELQFQQREEEPSAYSFDCSDYQEYNGVFYRDIPNEPNVAGWGSLCSHTSYPYPHPAHNFWLMLAQRGDWFAGSDADNIGQGELDFKGVVTHEVGHVTGFYGHFGGDMCDGPALTDQTMCSGLDFGFGSSSTQARTLEEHDKHTFDNAYSQQ